MSCVHGFREEKIDGKSFLLATALLNQPDNPSSSSSSTVPAGGNNDLHQPLFICPKLRVKAALSKLKQNGYESDASNVSVYIPISTSPEFPTKDQQVQYLLDSDSETEVCREPVVSFSNWFNNQETACSEYKCEVCGISDGLGTNHYFCVSCNVTFHKECVESPSEIKHPSYPFLSFQLSYCETERNWECHCCRAPIYGAVSYHCPTSKQNMHPVCAMKPIPLEIDHPKRHPHPLTLFPKQAYLPCNVCGLIKDYIPTYICVSCVSVVHQFVVHQDCAYSPTVIKISRHHHRISFTTSLPSGEWSCGVCRKAVDNNYGAYSCSKCHGYFVHTRCALRRDLWDGEELEGIPEEPEIVVEPFKTLPDGKILHFSHDHLLKLEVNRVYDEDKFCSACVLPIIFEDEFYSCMDQCDFILHEACANAPCRKHHPLHAHPLTLKVVTNRYQYNYHGDEGYFVCDACERRSCGFVYERNLGGFRLDLRCALVSEPFEYQCHEHPLFFALTPEEERVAVCQICQNQNEYVRKLNCIKCDFVICFTCATLPYKARYKHDKHLLTFRKEKETSDESGWCELCEYKLVYSQSGGFYLCDDCCTTLHVDCLLGKSPYMRHGHTIKFNWREKIQILRNNTMSRPFCHSQSCKEHRCPDGVFFKRENKTFCSFSSCT